MKSNNPTPTQAVNVVSALNTEQLPASKGKSILSRMYASYVSDITFIEKTTIDVASQEVRQFFESMMDVLDHADKMEIS